MSAAARASTVARGGAVNLFGNVVGFVEPLYLIAVSRLLGANALGGYILATTYVAMALRVTVLGIDKGLLRHVPMARAAPAPNAALASALGTALKVSIALGVSWSAVTFTAATWVGPDGGDGMAVLAIIAFALPAEAIGAVCLHALRGASNMVAFVVVHNVVVPAIMMAVGVPAILLGGHDSALAYAYLVAATGGAVVAWRWFRSGFGDTSVAAMRAAPIDGDLVRFSIPQGITELLNYLLSRADVVMIGWFFPDDELLVAVYGVSALIAGVPKKVRQAFDTALSPIMAEQIARGEADELRVLYRDVARWVTILFMLVAVGVSLAAPAGLAAFGDRYPQYWPVVPILCAARFLNAAGGPAQAALLMSGRSRLELVNNAFINGTNVLLNVFLIPRYGVYGAATATAISLTCFNLVRIGQARALVRVTPPVWAIARIAVAAGFAAAPCVALATYVDGPAGSVAATAAFVALYPLCLFPLGLGEDLRNTWRFVRRKDRIDG